MLNLVLLLYCIILMYQQIGIEYQCYVSLFFFSCNYYPSCPVNSEDPIPCRNGSFAPARSTYCHPCPIGSHCPSEKLSFHLPCANGSFSVTENSTICTECPAGSKCPNPALGPVECENGTYSKSGATHCIECPSGHRWEIILLVWFTWFWLTCFWFIKSGICMEKQVYPS